jgi:hypothetical protein
MGRRELSLAGLEMWLINGLRNVHQGKNLLLEDGKRGNENGQIG